MTTTDRLLAALACAYFCYRVFTAMRTGVYDGDGDRDVHADRNPLAFGITVALGIVLILLCAALAVLPRS